MRKTIVVFLGLVFLISLIVSIPIYHNIKLNEFASQLENIKYPGNVEVIESKKTCGKLVGNGNSMDYFACVLVRCQDKQEVLENLLFQSDIVQVGNKDKACEYREVVPVNGCVLESKYLQHGTIEFETLANKIEHQEYYALIIFDGGYDAFWDLRGH